MDPDIKAITDAFNYNPIHQGEEHQVEVKERPTRTRGLFVSSLKRIEAIKRFDHIEQQFEELDKGYNMIL